MRAQVVCRHKPVNTDETLDGDARFVRFSDTVVRKLGGSRNHESTKDRPKAASKPIDHQLLCPVSCFRAFVIILPVCSGEDRQRSCLLQRGFALGELLVVEVVGDHPLLVQPFEFAEPAGDLLLGELGLFGRRGLSVTGGFLAIVSSLMVGWTRVGFCTNVPS